MKDIPERGVVSGMRIARLLTWVALLAGSAASPGQEPVPPPPTLEAQAAPTRCVEQGGNAAQVSSAPRCWAEADYVLYWLKPVCFTVPGITVGNPGDREPGVLG